MTLTYAEHTPTPKQFADILNRSGLGARRPVDDPGRLARMLAGAKLTIIATDDASGEIVGIARSITDFSYACYLSDLAVDVAYQRNGIGKRLIELTRERAGPQCALILIANPDAVEFYKRLGMPNCDRAFVYPRLA
jgi:ribosomal protein S18 acetylase RimI-like enzyme